MLVKFETSTQALRFSLKKASLPKKREGSVILQLMNADGPLCRKAATLMDHQ